MHAKFGTNIYHTNSVNNAVRKPTVKNMATVRIFDIMCEKFKFPKKKINKHMTVNNVDLFMKFISENWKYSECKCAKKVFGKLCVLE
jgi:hypothetical protein